MRELTVKFRVRVYNNNPTTNEEIHIYLKDLLESSVLPALDVELVPLSFDVTKRRGA